MPKQNSKNIGNNFERKFSYQLSEWITGEQGSDICWRDQSSGSRYTKRKKENKETSKKADIVCTESKFQYFFDLFYIDTKSYKEFNWCWINNKNKKSNELLRQWIKTVKDCPENMIPIMPTIIRDRKTSPMIFLPNYIQINNNLPYIYINMKNEYSCILVLTDDFFKIENADNFYKSNKKI